MFVKKFEAPSLEQALALVKDEFGPTALVLSTAQKKGSLFQKAYVEVTAAIGEQEDEAAPAPRNEAIVYRAGNYSGASYAAPKPAPKRAEATEHRPKYVEIDAGEIPSAKRSGNRMEQEWLDLGFRSETAKEFSARLLQDFSHSDLKNPNFLLKAKLRLLNESIRTSFPETFDTAKRWLVIGGPGVGKTSTAVKMALYLKRSGREVVLSSLDSRKLLGSRELEKYARLLEIPYLRPEQTRTDPRIIIFDSSAYDERLPLKEAADEVSFDSVVAVVDSRERYNEASSFLKELQRSFRLSAVAFSRLDLAQTRGFLFDIMRTHKLPVLGASMSGSYKEPFKFFEPTEFSQYVLRKEAVV